jgi:hypothetical protein
MWERHQDLKPTIEKGWSRNPSGSPLDMAQTKLAGMACDLSRWGHDTFGSIRKEINTLKKEIEDLRNLPGRVGPSNAEIKINDHLVELYNREEIMWRQRSHVDWLAH